MFNVTVRTVVTAANGLFWGKAVDANGVEYWFGQLGCRDVSFDWGKGNLSFQEVHGDEIVPPVAGKTIVVIASVSAEDAAKKNPSATGWCHLGQFESARTDQLEFVMECDREMFQVEKNLKRIEAEQAMLKKVRDEEDCLKPPSLERAIELDWKELSRSGRQVIMVPPDGNRKNARPFYLRPAKTKKLRRLQRERAAVGAAK